jgi:nitrate reductase gamma subunit
MSELSVPKSFVLLSPLTAQRQVTQKTRLLSEEPDKVMLAKLRILEKKMGLVLTLVSIQHVRSHVISL